MHNHVIWRRCGLSTRHMSTSACALTEYLAPCAIPWTIWPTWLSETWLSVVRPLSSLGFSRQTMCGTHHLADAESWRALGLMWSPSLAHYNVHRSFINVLWSQFWFSGPLLKNDHLFLLKVPCFLIVYTTNWCHLNVRLWCIQLHQLITLCTIRFLVWGSCFFLDSAFLNCCYRLIKTLWELRSLSKYLWR